MLLLVAILFHYAHAKCRDANGVPLCGDAKSTFLFHAVRSSEHGIAVLGSHGVCSFAPRRSNSAILGRNLCVSCFLLSDMGACHAAERDEEYGPINAQKCQFTSHLLLHKNYIA